MRLGRVMEKVSTMYQLIDRCNGILEDEEDGNESNPLLPDEIYQVRDLLKEYVKIIRNKEIEI